MHISTLFSIFVVAVASIVQAAPLMSSSNHLEILQLRASTSVNSAAVTGTTCTDPSTYAATISAGRYLASADNLLSNIVSHDQNVAQLAICGGIAGAITKCGGAPKSTTGSSGTALFSLQATTSGATINVSKGRWEGCIRAARAVCPTGNFKSTCIGGASAGNVAFTLIAQ